MQFLVISAHWKIPREEFRFRFARSGGPGGQNVNKVSSKAILRWNVRHSPSLSADRRAALEARCRRRLTAEGDLLISSQRFRDAGRNAADCLAKLRRILLAIAAPPKPRKATRPTRASAQRRLDRKRRRALKKRSRREEPWS